MSPKPGSWTHEVSRGWLVDGTNQMEDWILKCDRGFNQYHKTDLVTGRAIHKRTERFILMQENCGDIPDKVLKLFVKERTFHDKG